MSARDLMGHRVRQNTRRAAVPRNFAQLELVPRQGILKPEFGCQCVESLAEARPMTKPCGPAHLQREE